MKKLISLASVAVLVVSAIGFTAKPAKANFPDSTGPWADSVYSFNQGLRRDGTPVLPEKSDPWQALGAAEGEDGETIISPGSGLSLGYRGELTVKFDNTILNLPGKDLTIVVVNDGQPDMYRTSKLSRGRVIVRVSQNGWDFKTIGAVTRTGSLDLGLLRWAKYVQLLDRSPLRIYPSEADAFDVDGIKAINSTSDQPWTGTNYDARWYRIDADPENDLWLGHDLKKSERIGWCNNLWDQAITFNNNWLMNSVDASGTAFRDTYFSTIGKSRYDGMTVNQLHEFLETMTCNSLTPRDVGMRNLYAYLPLINKGRYLWVATPVSDVRPQ